jgi:hypothetical protein
MAYGGKYIVKNVSKYLGDPSKVRFRSLWENAAFKFLEASPQVKYWSSETAIVPYICKTDGQRHNYFIDLKIVMTDGRTFFIEIKPKSQTREPKVQKRKTKAYINEVLTYVKNISKWEAAKEYALDRNATFAIWTEDTLREMGIKIL